MDTLNENQLDQWILILTEAKRVGYSLSSSPAELLLELMVDCALKLANQFQQGLGSWNFRKNEVLKFSQTKVDALNNPKVIRIREPETSTFNPLLSSFFKEMAQQLVQVKRLKDLPRDLYSEVGPKTGHQKIKTRAEVYHFFRRQARSKGRKYPKQHQS